MLLKAAGKTPTGLLQVVSDLASDYSAPPYNFHYQHHQSKFPNPYANFTASPPPPLLQHNQYPQPHSHFPPPDPPPPGAPAVYAPPPPPLLQHNQYPQPHSHFPPPDPPPPGAPTVYSHPPPPTFGAYAENGKFGACIISTSDLNFIRNELLRMIKITDRIQDRIEAMNSTIQNFTHTMSKSSQATSSISLLSPSKPKEFSEQVLEELDMMAEHSTIIPEESVSKQSILESRFDLKKVVMDKESIQAAKCDVAEREFSRNLVDTDMIKNNLHDANDAYHGAKDEMLKDEYINKRLKIKKLVDAHDLFDEMFNCSLNLHKLPWPPLFEYICCSVILYEIHDNKLLCNNNAFGCSIFIFDPGEYKPLGKNFIGGSIKVDNTTNMFVFDPGGYMDSHKSMVVTDVSMLEEHMNSLVNIHIHDVSLMNCVPISTLRTRLVFKEGGIVRYQKSKKELMEQQVTTK